MKLINFFKKKHKNKKKLIINENINVNMTNKIIKKLFKI